MSFIAFIVSCEQIIAQSIYSDLYIGYEPFKSSSSRNLLSNGKYNAVVKYISSNGYTSTYSWVVKVEYNTVVAIYTSNGKTIKGGFDLDYSYKFNGGKLSPVYDNTGNLVGLKAKVNVTGYYYDDDDNCHKINDIYYIYID